MTLSKLLVHNIISQEEVKTKLEIQQKLAGEAQAEKMRLISKIKELEDKVRCKLSRDSRVYIYSTYCLPIHIDVRIHTAGLHFKYNYLVHRLLKRDMMYIMHFPWLDHEHKQHSKACLPAKQLLFSHSFFCGEGLHFSAFHYELYHYLEVSE